MMASKNNRALYVGVTSDLYKRVDEHREHLVEGFTKRYNCIKLVYFEAGGDAYSAITREKEIKKWRREKKDRLVNKDNPEWVDLYPGLVE
jgi:putative endonuclease